MDYFKNEYKVRKIGGKLSDTYYYFQQLVFYINDNRVPLFLSLGFTERDKDIVLNALSENISDKDLCELFIEWVLRKVNEGEISMKKIAPASTIKRIESLPPEDKEEKTQKLLHRVLVFRYRGISEKFRKEYKPSSFGYQREAIEMFRDALDFTPSGLYINVEKFIELYLDYTKASQSDAGKLHEKIVKDINCLFNGVEITENELKKYFRIENGAIKAPPMKREDYARLGTRHFKVKKAT